MTIDPRSVAVEGIGGEPIAVATLGYVSADTVTVVQTSGIASVEAFGSSSATMVVFTSGLNSTEEHETNNNVTCEITNNGHASDEIFGSDGVEVSLGSSGVASDELFGTDTTTVTVDSVGLDSSEAFGPSFASYERTVTQNSGIPSSEAFGFSSVSRPSVAVVERPLQATRRGGSKALSKNGSSWDVTVTAELLTRAQDVLYESEPIIVRGAVKKRVDATDRVVVKARRFVELTSETPPVVEVQGRLLSINTLEESTIIVRAEKIAKVA